MKLKLTIALTLFFLSLANVIYWIIYWNKNETLVKSDYNTFIRNYVNSMPGFIRPLFPFWSTLIGLLMFLIAGILFLRTKGRVYSMLGIFSLLLAAWHLFSLL